jgi:hypothetical protein
MYYYTIRAAIGNWSHEWTHAHTLTHSGLGCLHFTTMDGKEVCVHGEWMFEEEK